MAYQSGLRVGDILVSMNGVPCVSHEQSVEVINRSSAPRVLADSEIVCLVIPQAADVKPHGAPEEGEEEEEGRGGARLAGELLVDECTIL